MGVDTESKVIVRHRCLLVFVYLYKNGVRVVIAPKHEYQTKEYSSISSENLTYIFIWFMCFHIENIYIYIRIVLNESARFTAMCAVRLLKCAIDFFWAIVQDTLYHISRGFFL